MTLAFTSDSRLFYNELLTGNIRIITPNGKLLEQPFYFTAPPEAEGGGKLTIIPSQASYYTIEVDGNQLSAEPPPPAAQHQDRRSRSETQPAPAEER